MFRGWRFLALLGLAACGSGTPWETGVGTVENGLPYDGCSWVVDVGGTKYVPDAASLPELRSAVADASGVTPIALTFRPTGQTGKAECGFGSEQALPEIEISSVMKR